MKKELEHLMTVSQKEPRGRDSLCVACDLLLNLSGLEDALSFLKHIKRDDSVWMSQSMCLETERLLTDEEKERKQSKMELKKTRFIIKETLKTLSRTWTTTTWMETWSGNLIGALKCWDSATSRCRMATILLAWTAGVEERRKKRQEVNKQQIKYGTVHE